MASLGLASSASRIETEFERVNSLLARQQELLSELQVQCSNRSTRDEMTAFRDAVLDSLRRLESRVTALEGATAVPDTVPTAREDDHRPLTVTEALHAVSSRVRALEASNEAKPTREELDTRIHQVREHADVQLAALEDAKASKTALTAVEGAVVACRRRCDALDVAVARKADVSVLAEVEAAAATVQQERERLEALGAAQRSAEARLAAAEAGLEEEVRRGEGVLRVLEALPTQLGERATRAELEEALAAVQGEGERERGAALARLQATEEALAASRTELEQLQAEAAEARRKGAEAEAEAASLREAVGRCALKEEAWPASRGEAGELALARLRAALDTRAASEAVEAAQRGVEAAQRRLDATDARVAVALEFVEWYAAKGEAMEHNGRVVDEHLRRMAGESALTAAATQAARAAMA